MNRRGALALSGACGITAGCRPSLGEDDHLLVYTSIAVDIANQIVGVFSSRFPELPVRLFQSGSEALIRRIENEREAGGMRADVLMLADPSYYMTLKMQGDLAKYESEQAQAVPNALKDPDGYYAAVRVISMLLVHNTGMVPAAEAPRNWDELHHPKWASQVVMSSPLYSGSTYATVAVLAQRYGWEYFERLRAAGVVVEQATQGVERRLAAGEFKVGINIDYSIRQGKARGSPVDVVLPRDGAVVLPSPIAVVKKRETGKLRAAHAFYDFMLSEDGQRAIVNGYMLPVRHGMEGPAGVPTTEEMLRRALPIDWVHVATSQQEIKERWRRIMH